MGNKTCDEKKNGETRRKTQTKWGNKMQDKIKMGRQDVKPEKMGRQDARQKKTWKTKCKTKKWGEETGDEKNR